ncbi:hypothetical protein CEV08_03850 [Bartonella tribocorum]|uniref:Uncharacterized protein n=1 Tax=Bartonella tribocorum TaxID=85701 RepID=A0A2M6UW85_9HYPH|nr:hypothetical protein CEV08_03850 [Bartonella tribocorum]
MKALLLYPYSSHFIQRKILNLIYKKVYFYTNYEYNNKNFVQLIERFTIINHEKMQHCTFHRVMLGYMNIKKEDSHCNIKNSFASSSYSPLSLYPS